MSATYNDVVTAVENAIDACGPKAVEEGVVAAMERERTGERRVVQVSTCENDTLALCNDGTVWTLHRMNWIRLPDIPQGEVTQ